MMQPARLTVLVENTALRRGLLAEHGLAFWLELGPRRVLFDSGQSNVLCHNAERLGVDLGRADSLVLSHGHYDHTGGLSAALEKTGPVKAFVHPAALGPKYARNADGTARDIGMPAPCRDALRQTADVTFTEQPMDVGGALRVTGPVPRLTDFEDTGGPFFVDSSCRRPDELTDDQAAFFETAEGTVVILGCAHAGIINTLRYVRQLVPRQPIHTVVGGTHLTTADEARMDATVAALRQMEIGRLMPVHCTGSAAATRLRQEFPGRVQACPVGAVVEF
ncbi:MAG: MBL fold metallo-hydrolase [Kiritimatiellae bacterium]|nr:MBL fold metallo-hydrolase [Kiritimatiellia bacterium]